LFRKYCRPFYPASPIQLFLSSSSIQLYISGCSDAFMQPMRFESLLNSSLYPSSILCSNSIMFQSCLARPEKCIIPAIFSSPSLSYSSPILALALVSYLLFYSSSSIQPLINKLIFIVNLFDWKSKMESVFKIIKFLKSKDYFKAENLHSILIDLSRFVLFSIFVSLGLYENFNLMN